MFPWSTIGPDAKPEITMRNGEVVRFSYWHAGSPDNHYNSFNIQLPVDSCRLGMAFPLYGKPWKIQLTETELKEMQRLIKTFAEMIAEE